MAEELCDGNKPLIDPATNFEYSCSMGEDMCPAGSYCHKLGAVARCCREGECTTGMLSKIEFYFKFRERKPVI